LWPGFGDNVRALDWLLRRLDGAENIAEKTAIGYIPSEGALNLEGLKEPVDTKQLFSLPKDFWLSEVSFESNWLLDQCCSLTNVCRSNKSKHTLRSRWVQTCPNP
jgi:phosphoenolpyruvate carboxykinase (GTP)